MSVDPRVIADLITDDIHVFNEGLLVIEDLSRREFLQKLGGYTATGMIKNPAALLQKIATGAVSGKALEAVGKTIANMSNDELSRTPEELWLPYISDGRLKQFMAEHPVHFNNEMVFKFYNLVNYMGGGYELKHGVASKLIDLIGARSGVKPSSVINQAFTSPYAGLFSGFEKNDLIRAAKSKGIALDYGIVNRYFKDLENELERELESEMEFEKEERSKAAEERSKEAQEWAATVHGGVQPGDRLGYERYKSDPRFESIEAIARTLE